MDPRPYLLPFLFLCLFFILCSQLASMPTRVSCSLRGRNTNPDGGAGAGKNGDRQITLFFRSIKRTLSLNKSAPVVSHNNPVGNVEDISWRVVVPFVLNQQRSQPSQMVV
ncbi:uncharacterized protein LOC114261658 [Camellia sinensis]|uniref:uncharacterized protein LOC114261658 n=1 Tax=Camellia sinensis TaxID=4442 RepID=UPI001036365A|nr:uncharacterized protein LOC114261658 [Camellia sinensis]